MAGLLVYAPARFNFLFRAGIFWFAIATYLVGAAALTFGTLLSALYLTFRWLQDGVWRTYTLSDLLSGQISSHPLAGSESWFLETSLLVAMPIIGGILMVAGIVIFVGSYICSTKGGKEREDHLPDTKR